MRSHPLLDDRIEMLHRLTNAARTDANAERVCAVSDKDKKDKHEYQGGTTLPRVD